MKMLFVWLYSMRKLLGISIHEGLLNVVALEIKPGRTTSLATSVNKQCMVLLSDKVRLATEQDFDDFHICFDGFRNNTMYCYNQGTEPIYLQ